MRENCYPEELRIQVDRYLSGLSFSRSSDTAGLQQAMKYSLLAPGKRIRPVLCLATGNSLGIDPEQIMPLAASLEMIHTYSLIHDDLPALDNDDLRRNMPTCHVEYGEDVAILAGDALFAEAFIMIVEKLDLPAEMKIAALGEIASATGAEGMVGGQFIDVAQAAKMDEAKLRKMHSLKTGCLIEASVACVLRIGECAGESGKALRAFAKELGVLFQIVDDILDVVGSEEEMGKAVGSDRRLQKHTYVSTFGLDRAKQMAETAKNAVMEQLDLVHEDTEELQRITEFIFSRTR